MHDIERKSQSLLQQAEAANASDIHLIPKRQQALIRFRIDGVLTEIDTIPKRLAEKLTSHFKFLAGMDIGEKRRPQNGALDMTVEQSRIHLRLSTLPTPFNESLVLRILPQERTFSFSKLSLFPDIHSQLKSMMKKANGFILLTGPTGSGKTTLLYSLLHAAAEYDQRQIITLEDPIEQKSEAFVQVELNEKANVTFAEGFTSILRHDPDIIMVGEIRDYETAKIAVRAAMTGHLVLSTIHTKDTIGCIYRLMELGIPRTDLQQVMTAVVAQRLVELYCPFCGEVCSPKCRMRRKTRRLGVYEMLSGPALAEVLDNQQPTAYKTLKDLIKRGIAYGYLSKRSYERWMDD